MSKKIIIKKIDNDRSTIEAEFHRGSDSTTLIYPLPGYGENKELSSKELKEFLVNAFPHFEVAEPSNDKDFKTTISEEAHSLIDNEFFVEEVVKEKQRIQEIRSYTSTMYGSKHNIMAIRHIVMNTLHELGVIK